MESYTEKDMRFLSSLKARVVERHKPCRGVGYLESAADPCVCMKVFKYFCALRQARIPSDYWPLSLRELHVEHEYKKLAKDYADNLENAIERGLGIVFIGEKGIGKTSITCEIGKRAVQERYRVYFDFVQNIVKDNFDDEHPVMARISAADIVIMDELDKVMMKANSSIPKMLDLFFRDLSTNGKAILASMNMSKDDFERDFELTSLLRRKIKFIEMEGEDFSPRKQEEWLENLKNPQDFFTETVVKAAERFHSNQAKADEREYDNLF